MRYARLFISGAIAVMLGLTWTVAQTGLTDTNAHLCEFAGRFIPGLGSKCQVSDYIVGACGLFALLAAVFFLIDLIGVVPRLTKRRGLASSSSVAQLGAEQRALDVMAAHTEELRRQREAQAIADDPIQTAVRAAFTRKYDTLIQSKTSGPDLPAPPATPDMPIRDLFFSVDINCLEEKGERANEIGADLLDKLSVGELRAWGRVADVGSRRPLTEIGARYWAEAELTYMFFGAGDAEQVHVQPRPFHIGSPYSDLRFNRAQVESVQFKPTKRFMPLLEAALHAHEESPQTIVRIGRDINRDDSGAITTWWCYLLSPKLVIFGEHLPSRKREVYSDMAHRNGFDFFIESAQVIAKERQGNGRWINLCVRKADLERIIEEIKGHEAT